jgi:uncharacterized LabA/DUF88 family protein
VSASAPLQVAVFFDWQNAYRSAIDAFGPGTNGNVNPWKLAEYLARSRPTGSARGELCSVDIYSGIPSQKRDPVSYAARRRQHAAWDAMSPLLTVHTRTLAYRPDGAGGFRAEEKGIDVALGIALVRAALIDKRCDVCVLVSADTDLLPALESIVESKGAAAVEVATWKGPHYGPGSLAVEGHRVRQHELTEKLITASRT